MSASVTRRQRLRLFDAQRHLADTQRARAGLVDVALSHHISVGELRIQNGSRGRVRPDPAHRNSAGAQIVEAVAGLDDDDLGVTYLAFQPSARLDHWLSLSCVTWWRVRSPVP